MVYPNADRVYAPSVSPFTTCCRKISLKVVVVCSPTGSGFGNAGIIEKQHPKVPFTFRQKGIGSLANAAVIFSCRILPAFT